MQERREMLSTMTEKQESKWIAAQLDAFASGHHQITYTFMGHTLSQEDWCGMNGFSKFKLNTAKKWCQSATAEKIDEILQIPVEHLNVWN
jgi:hypothetical protein